MRLLISLLAFTVITALPASLYAAAPPSKAELAHYAEQLLTANYTKGGPGAAVIVARGDEVLFRGARGMADVEHATSLSASGLFDIASITKQFAAAGLLKLAEAGKVSLDDPLSKFVKDYPNGDNITVLELLNHTSGIKSYTELPVPVGKAMTTAQLIDSFKSEKPDFAPGTYWAYDNSGYVLVGAVIEVASGMPWCAYLRQTLLQPLGLSHTGCGGDPAVIARQAHGYTMSDGKPVPAPLLSALRPYADGSLVSNVDDLLKWNRALHRGRVLKGDSYRRMITPVGKAVPEQYGLGLWHTTLRGHEMIGHSGHISGFSAYLLYLPQSRISVAILQNMDRAPGVADPTQGARQLAAFAIGEPYPAVTPVAVDVLALQQAQGAYGTDPPGPRELSPQGARVLRVIDGKLTMARTGDDRAELIPIAAGTFQAGSSFDRLRLERDPAGAVTAVRLFPWGEGEGLLLTRTSGPPPPAQLSLPRAALERLAGPYEADGLAMRVFLDGERLKIEIGGQPPDATLLAETANKFFAAEVDATLEFTPAEGMPQVAILHQGSDVIEFKRKQ